MSTLNRPPLVITLFLLTAFLTGATVTRELPEGIAEAFSKGHSRNLARHFNNNIELVVPDHEDVYSKSQAELILRDFFSEHKPVKFEYLHKGGKEISRYGIGSLETEKGDFRIYFLLKVTDGTPLIHLLRIERAEESP
ncbi:MAG: DUF4783 domain-containing protein [Marinilabiliales bacterium]|nr:MAG: DUF4783 domain-containing protein [Marinilabiliales bacterium]